MNAKDRLEAIDHFIGIRDHYASIANHEQREGTRLRSLAGQTRSWVKRAWFRVLADGHTKREREALLRVAAARKALRHLRDQGPRLSPDGTLEYDAVTSQDQAERMAIRDLHRRRTEKW